MNYIAQSPAVPLAELSHFACHYPLGDPRDEDFGYCGAAAKVGSRYCERHHRLCYTTSAGRLGIGNADQAPRIAGTWSAHRDHSGPLTVWRSRSRHEPQIITDVTREALIAAKKQRDARMRAATIDPEKEAALLKKREEERRQAEADRKAEQERRFWMTANAVTSFLRGAAEGVRGGLRRVRVRDIQREVCAYYKVSVDDLLSHRRTVALAKPRHVAMFLAKTLTQNSLPEIGRRFARRDHSTIFHGVHKIGALIETDAELRAEVEAIRASLTGRGTIHV